MYLHEDADLFLFDDVLSALDAGVATQIYNACLLGILRQKTRVLVLNSHLNLLRANVDQIVVIQMQNRLLCCMSDV